MTLTLNLPPREPKPRNRGRTNLLDKGHGPRFLDDQLQVVGGHVDLAKLGWGTSVVSHGLEEKIEIYRSHGIDVCLGGTLFELVFLQDKLDDYEKWMMGLGLTTMEISDGTLTMDSAEKLRHIERFSANFEVLSEVGSKDSTAVVSPARWVKAINAELAAGAKQVILEGRESGTAGLYRQSGEIRMGLIEEILDSGVEAERLVFEAPLKAQQVWLIENLGPAVNLANIPLEDALSVETLRLGLRSDTLAGIHGLGNAAD